MNSDNIIPMGGLTRLDLPAEKILRDAIDELDDVVIAGWDKNGDFYCAANCANGAEVLWLLEEAKRQLFIRKETQ